jgi:hypothetical protein
MCHSGVRSFSLNGLKLSRYLPNQSSYFGLSVVAIFLFGVLTGPHPAYGAYKRFTPYTFARPTSSCIISGCREPKPLTFRSKLNTASCVMMRECFFLAWATRLLTLRISGSFKLLVCQSYHRLNRSFSTRRAKFNMSSHMITSIQFVFVPVAVCAYFVYLILQRRQPKAPPQQIGDLFRPEWAKDSNIQNEAAVALSKLVQYDGAGTWPPRSDHVNWPRALVPYRDTYFEMVPLLSSAAASLDDNINNAIREDFRTKMRKLLKQRIDIQEVEDIMFAAELGGPGSLPRSSYNGFYNCIAVCRHMYRYTILAIPMSFGLS